MIDQLIKASNKLYNKYKDHKLFLIPDVGLVLMEEKVNKDGYVTLKQHGETYKCKCGSIYFEPKPRENYFIDLVCKKCKKKVNSDHDKT